MAGARRGSGGEGCQGRDGRWLPVCRGGVGGWRRDGVRRAVGEGRPDASAGDADAQCNLGQAYKLGRGVPVDMAMAESWYRKAADQGRADA